MKTELVRYHKGTGDARLTLTIKLTNNELSDIGAHLNYLVSTFDRQDSVLLGLPGEEGKAVVNGLSKQVYALILELNRQTIPGYTR